VEQFELSQLRSWKPSLRRTTIIVSFMLSIAYTNKLELFLKYYIVYMSFSPTMLPESSAFEIENLLVHYIRLALIVL
jgi:hypothetical protein